MPVHRRTVTTVASIDEQSGPRYRKPAAVLPLRVSDLLRSLVHFNSEVRSSPAAVPCRLPPFTGPGSAKAARYAAQRTGTRRAEAFSQVAQDLALPSHPPRALGGRGAPESHGKARERPRNPSEIPRPRARLHRGPFPNGWHGIVWNRGQ